MKRWKRIVSLLLALTLLSGLLTPVRVWAEEAETTPPVVEETAATETAETVETTVNATNPLALDDQTTNILAAAEMVDDGWVMRELEEAELSAVFAQSHVSGASPSGVGDHSYDEKEPNDDASTANYVANDYTVSGSVSGSDLLDFFALELSSESNLVIVAAAEYSSFMMVLFDSEGNALGSDTTGEYNNGVYVYTLYGTLNPGWKYLALLDGNKSDNNYLLYTTFEPVASCDHSSYTSMVTAPTCVDQGYTTFTCNSCGESWTDNYTEANGQHIYTDDSDVTCNTCGEYRGDSVAKGVCGEKVKWALSDSGVLTISGTGAMLDYSENSTPPWYSNRSSIMKVVVEEGVTGIGSYAFYECENLSDVLIPDTVVSLGDCVFYYCDNLKFLYVPESVSEISSDYQYTATFHNCCVYLQVFFGAKEVQPGWGKYWDYRSAKIITPNYKYRVELGYTREQYEYWMTLDREQRSITVPSWIDRVPGYAFQRAEKLKSVVLPEETLSIGNNAFEGCTLMTSLNVPISVASIGTDAFQFCDSLVIRYEGTMLQWMQLAYVKAICSDGTILGIGEGRYVDWFVDNTYQLTLFGEGAMPDYSTANMMPWRNYVPHITSIQILGELTEIGDRAFTGCEKLTSVSIPDTVIRIGDYAFSDCASLKSITIPRSVSYIGREAFYNDKALKNIIFGHGTSDPLLLDGGAFAISNGIVATTIKVPVKTAVNAAISGYDWKNDGRTVVYWSDNCSDGHVAAYENVVDPTCAQPGRIGKTYCMVCGKLLAEDTELPALGHDMGQWEITKEATCTQDGEKRRDCSRCDQFQTSEIKAPGHTEIIDPGFPATCTEAGLTEGKHCAVCEAVLTAQEEIPAAGHDYAAREDGVACTACGETRFLQIRQDYLLLDLQVNNQARLTLDLSPDFSMDDVHWHIEGEEDIVSVDRDGLVTALGAGNVFVVAKVEKDAFSVSARCRVEVLEAPRIDGIQLGVQKMTSELYSAEYAELPVLLRMPQNDTTSSAVADQLPEDLGVAIDSARFADDAMARLFGLIPLDDRRLAVVPTDYALENPKQVKGSYKSIVTVIVDGSEYFSEELILTVKKSTPKLKAAVDPFNSFYPEELRKITITGATVTGISLDPTKAQPDWLTLGEDGILSLTEAAPRKNVSGKLNLLVETAEWAIPAAVPLTVKNAYKEPTLKLSARTVNLNTAVKDTAYVTVTATPSVDELDFRLTDSTGKVDKTGELDVSCENGRFAICATDKSSGSYKLHISTGGSKETALTIKVISAVPTVTYKVKGNPDLNIPEQFAEVTPTFKNYNGGFTVAALKAESAKKQDVTAQFWTEQAGNTIRVFCMEHTPAGAYTLKLKLALDDGSFVENTARISVKQTALKVKLSASKLTLNKQIDDSASVTVTSATKGYTLEKPVWTLMDKTGKVSAEGRLDIGFEKGKLTAAVNEATEYGATYKLLVRANETSAAQTLTIAILAENKSAVTSTLKAKGNLDVIRDGSAVTLTAAYKNCADAKKTEELVFYKTVGKETVEVNDLFTYTANTDGTFTVTKAESAKLDHSGKYTVKLVTYIGGSKACESKPIALAVKMGTAKLILTAKDTVLFAKDSKDRAEFRIDSTDTALNGIAKIELKDTKQKNLFELFDYGNGTYAMGFKEGKVDKSLIGKTVTVNLNVFLNGNETAKVNTTVKIKLTVLK